MYLNRWCIINFPYLAGFLLTLPPNGLFASNGCFRPRSIFRVAIMKTKSATIAFFSSPRSFSFSFLFPLFLWSWSFSGLRNLFFDAFSLKWLQISLGWFSKNRLDIDIADCAGLYLTIIPRARIGWINSPFGLRPHGLLTWNNCFIKIQLVGQKFRDKTT